MRDWSAIDKAYAKLLAEVYPQPDSDGHTNDAKRAIDWFLKRASISSVLDLGASTGFCSQFFPNIEYTGVAFGEDVRTAQALGRNVIEADYNFLPDDLTADAILSRHSLEHSPFPHLTLLSWMPRARYIMLVLPSYEWYRAGTRGSNHYAVWDELQWKACFNTVGAKVLDSFVTYRNGKPDRVAPDERTQDEYWYLLKAGDR